MIVIGYTNLKKVHDATVVIIDPNTMQEVDEIFLSHKCIPFTPGEWVNDELGSNRVKIEKFPKNGEALVKDGYGKTSVRQLNTLSSDKAWPLDQTYYYGYIEQKTNIDNEGVVRTFIITGEGNSLNSDMHSLYDVFTQLNDLTQEKDNLFEGIADEIDDMKDNMIKIGSIVRPKFLPYSHDEVMMADMERNLLEGLMDVEIIAFSGLTLTLKGYNDLVSRDQFELIRP